MTGITEPTTRSVLFISKATPGDDEFALWLAPRLEAAGYEVLRILSPCKRARGGEKRLRARPKTVPSRCCCVVLTKLLRETTCRKRSALRSIWQRKSLIRSF